VGTKGAKAELQMAAVSGGMDSMEFHRRPRSSINVRRWSRFIRKARYWGAGPHYVSWQAGAARVARSLYAHSILLRL